MKLAELFTELRSRDVHISANGERLRCSAPDGVLTAELLDELQRHKPEILEFLHSTEAQTHAQRAIVPLEPGGARTPVFGVGGHNGDVFCYRVLAQHLGKGQPFYGLQPPGLDGVSEPLMDIIELAGYFADQIRAVRPHGPVVIAGFCAGGTTAFELAQQLQRTGTEVECLVLLGAPWPGCYRRHVMLQIKLGEQWKRVLKYATELGRLSFSSWSRLIAEKIRAQKAQRSATVTDPVLILRARVEEATIAAASRYVPEHYPGRVRHFLPNTDWANTRFVPQRWKSVAPHIEEQYGPLGCNADNLLQEPWVAAVARFYQNC